MQKYIYLLTIVVFMIFSGCNESIDTPNNKREVSLFTKTEIDSLLTVYDKHANNYSNLYKKALYGDKNALKSYSDLMLEINVLDNKLQYLINQNKIASNQLKKYMNLKKKFTQ
ncbi:hypothetical protein HX017_14845 [Myroides marinus]|nr:hypothetical protein [Myroides marinus]MDM1348369.1 hypothetical protein [Myroides marinus]MDM1351876.1 hypothetical protein [Myroides marinus]MDM1355562.1 hypothetical protein [Myroides marinus]MDM1359088.1 hypothetical protein [Myroides marinus]MDM1362773.1 hypothetical protein [Myroides marinus]